MKAVIVGPSAIAETIAPVVQQRGVTVVDRIDVNPAILLAYFEQSQSKCDLVLFVSTEDLNETRASICGLRILLACPILVFGVARSVSEVVQIMRSGATDFIEMSGDFVSELNESLQRLIESEHKTQPSGKVIGLVSAVGGSGQTAVATNLAAYLAAIRHSTTVLVDLNLSGGDSAEQLGLVPKQTIADFPSQSDEKYDVPIDSLLEHHKSGLKVLAGPKYLGNHRIISAESVKVLISLLAQPREFVVLDVEDAFHSEQLAALKCSDIVIVVTRLDFPSVLRTKRLLEHFEQNDLSNIRIVANNYIKGISIPEKKVESVLKRSVSGIIPNEPTSVLNGINMGEPAVLEFPRSKFSQAISHVADALLATAT